MQTFHGGTYDRHVARSVLSGMTDELSLAGVLEELRAICQERQDRAARYSSEHAAYTAARHQLDALLHDLTRFHADEAGVTAPAGTVSPPPAGVPLAAFCEGLLVDAMRGVGR